MIKEDPITVSSVAFTKRVEAGIALRGGGGVFSGHWISLLAVET